MTKMSEINKMYGKGTVRRRDRGDLVLARPFRAKAWARASYAGSEECAEVLAFEPGTPWAEVQDTLDERALDCLSSVAKYGWEQTEDDQ
jgi:hypothetical protein